MFFNLVFLSRKNQMQICTHALKIETFNVGLHAAKADKAAISCNAVDQKESGVLSFSSPDQTFTLTASKVNEMLLINRISLISSQAIARIRLSALH
jgi:hypothetical protein